MTASKLTFEEGIKGFIGLFAIGLVAWAALAYPSQREKIQRECLDMYSYDIRAIQRAPLKCDKDMLLREYRRKILGDEQ